jgi:IS30 family transposase
VRGTEIVAEEREFIPRQLAIGSSFREIGRLLKRDHTVISREVERNGGRSACRVISAQRRAAERTGVMFGNDATVIIGDG